MYLEHQKHKEPSHGKIPVKKLVGQGEGAKSIEVTDSNIKSFERVARKYNVDFAVKRDKTTEPPRYLVFFKGKDADVIAQAFKEFVKVNEKKQQRPSLRQKLKGLKTVVTAIGAGVGVWGVINLLEGYGNDNPGANAHVP